MIEWFVHSSEAEHGASPAAVGVRHFATAEAALAALPDASAEAVYLCDGRVDRSTRPPEEWERFDLLHAGLSLGAAGTFPVPQLASLNWFLLDPPAERRCVSWKATPTACWVRPATVRALGGFDPAYASPDSRLMDLAYRLMMAGGRVCHDPGLRVGGEARAALAAAPARVEIPLVDQFVFLCRHLGRREALYAAIWHGITQRSPVRSGRALRTAIRQAQRFPAPRAREDARKGLRLIGTAKRQQVGSISAIIPTVNRYDYLPGAIESLLRQDPCPDEIIVVDQTPAEKRRPEIYEPFAGKPVRVIYLERAGQSISRNTAIEAASGDWCLLFDDDQAAWDGMLAQHVALVEQSGAQISTGVALAPWKTVEHIPPALRHPRAADVLATGNALVHRAAILEVGGLDRAFDRGSGADDDLGARLYLNGCESIFNPRAIMTHYKAPKGGLRLYGAWWRDRTTFWAPYPPPTQVYAVQRRYPRSFWWAHYLRFYLRAGHQYPGWLAVWLWVAAPWKLGRALRAAKLLEAKADATPDVARAGSEPAVVARSPAMHAD